ISIVSIHTIGLLALLSAVALAINTWQRRGDTPWLGSISKYLAAGLIIFIIASSYWLIPLLFGAGSTASTISSFTAGDRQAFATIGDNPASQLTHVARLQGFWEEARAMYALPQQQVRAWGILVLLVWALLAVGIVNLLRNKQREPVYIFGTSSL